MKTGARQARLWRAKGELRPPTSTKGVNARGGDTAIRLLGTAFARGAGGAAGLTGTATRMCQRVTPVPTPPRCTRAPHWLEWTFANLRTGIVLVKLFPGNLRLRNSAVERYAFMICYRRACLSKVLLCFCAAMAATALAQNPPAPQQPAPQQPPPTQEKKPQNPFETVPEQAPPEQTKPAPPAPQQPVLEAPKPAEQPKAQPGGQVIEAIDFRGARRVQQDTLRALIS